MAQETNEKTENAVAPAEYSQQLAQPEKRRRGRPKGYSPKKAAAAAAAMLANVVQFPASIPSYVTVWLQGKEFVSKSEYDNFLRQSGRLLELQKGDKSSKKII
jgi:hypothetical protein